MFSNIRYIIFQSKVKLILQYFVEMKNYFPLFVNILCIGDRGMNVAKSLKW